jgi:predicted TIM-barrel fold metal-dependent hydrolase
LLEAMEWLHLPIVLWHSEATWPEIAELCRGYPNLRVIVEGTGRKLLYDNRIYYAFLERFPNLFLETHNLTNYLELDQLVKRFGSGRFLFGSFFPHLDPNSAAMPLSHAGFTEEDKRNIAHGNLERLLAEVQAG